MKQIKQVIQFNPTTISSLFSENTPYLIPSLQRTFQWNEGNKNSNYIITLWDDLKDYRDVHKMEHDYQYEFAQKYANVAPYLIGATYVTEAWHKRDDGNVEKVNEVLDGQQRLTTLFIGLIVLQEMYAQIQSNVILNKCLEKINEEKRLLSQNSPEDIFDQVKNVLYYRATGPRLRYARKSTNEFWKRITLAKGSSEIDKALATQNPDIKTEVNIAAAFDIYRKKIFIEDRFPEFGTFKFKWDKTVWKTTELVKICSSKFKGDKKLDRNNIENYNYRSLGDFLTCLCGLASTILHCVGFVEFKCEQQQVSLFDIINNRGKSFDENDLTRIVLLSACSSTEIQNSILENWNNITVDQNLLAWCWNAFYADEISQMAKKQIHYQIEDRLKNLEHEDERILWVHSLVENVVNSYGVIKSIPNEVQYGTSTFYRDAIVKYFDFLGFAYPVVLAIEKYLSEDLNLRQKIYKYLFNVLVRIKVIKQKGKERNTSQTAELPRLGVRLCKAIRENACSNKLLSSIETVVLTNSIYGELIKDEYFQNQFEDYSLVGEDGKEVAPNKFGYLLISMFECEQYGATTLAPYGAANKFAMVNNLEHIFPQTPSEELGWIVPADQAHLKDAIINKIGNLLPLNGNMNSCISNGSLDDKVDAYSKSQLKLWSNLKALMQEGCSKDEYSWTFEKIEKRSSLLAETAVHIFKLHLS